MQDSQRGRAFSPMLGCWTTPEGGVTLILNSKGKAIIKIHPSELKHLEN
jgi:hypothetical protein